MDTNQQGGEDMTEADEKRLIDVLMAVSNKEYDDMFCRFLAVGKAAREFREEGELRCGDEVQVRYNDSDWMDAAYIGHRPDNLKAGVVLLDGEYKAFGFGLNLRLRPKTERRLLDQVALMQWFDDHDWRPDCDGIYRHLNHAISFNPSLWQYCGLAVDDIPEEPAFSILSDWIEEVEVGR